MAEIDIRRLDFSLLQIFAELLDRRKATDVAARLGITQSTVSHALNRLRDLFGDELFIRRPYGLDPTARALALQPAVRSLLDAAENLLGPGEPFDPRTASATIRIGASDYNCSLLIPDLLARIRALAPGMVVSVRPLVRRQAAEALAAGDLDIAIGYFWGRTPGLTVEPLFEEDYAAVLRKDHRALQKNNLTLAAYLGADHILVSYDGDVRGVVDATLANMGKSRRVAATVPFFLSAFAMVARTDLIVTVPSRVAVAYAPRFGLTFTTPPLPIRRFRVAQAWHQRQAEAPIREWTSEQVRSIGRLEAGGDRLRPPKKKSRNQPA
jgi:DNA-binding transcriptional LysR family regulator